MADFPSEEWARLIMEEVNKSPAYAMAARTWEGDFLFVLDKDDTFPRTMGIYMDLWHGKCRSTRLVTDVSGVKAAFLYRSTYTYWKELLLGQLHPVKDILTGKIRIEGNVTVLLGHRRAAEELLAAARRVPTTFK